MRCGLKTPVVFSTNNANLESDNIPWHLTNNMANARKTLLTMYDHFDNESPVKAFLNSNCLHLIKEPTGDSGISKSYFDIQN
jgi:hypothetical protein